MAELIPHDMNLVRLYNVFQFYTVSELSLTLVLVGVMLWIFKEFQKHRKYHLPPGPPKIPFLGNLHQMIAVKAPPYKMLQNFSSRYGPVMSLYLGLTNQVVIDDYEILKKVLHGDDWGYRYADEWILERSFGKLLGIFFSRDEEWKCIRRFSLRTLRNFGLGKQKGQGVFFQEEFRDIVTAIDDKINSGRNILYMNEMFSIQVLNILWCIVTGNKFSQYDEKRVQKIMENVLNTSKAITLGGNIAMAFPLLRHIFPLLPFTNLNARKRHLDSMHVMFRELLEDRRAQGHYKNNQSDFIDAFLFEIDRCKENPSLPQYYTEEQFSVTVLDLFSAGANTTTHSLEFAFLFMIHFPHIQKKVQEDIDKNIGRNRLPTIMDMQRMPYTEATLLETARMSSIFPIFFRSAVRDTKIGPYDIKEGTLGLFNCYSIHYNEELWGDPLVFRPERFLDKDNKIINSERILSFGLGSRQCIGEVLAKSTLFLFFTGLLQRYTFEKSPEHELPSYENPRVGITLSAINFYAAVKPRD